MFDVVSGEYVGRNIPGIMKMALEAGQTLNIVCVPAGTVLKKKDGRLMAGEHVVKY